MAFTWVIKVVVVNDETKEAVALSQHQIGPVPHAPTDTDREALRVIETRAWAEIEQLAMHRAKVPTVSRNIVDEISQ